MIITAEEALPIVTETLGTLLGQLGVPEASFA
jgi:hypothetical protein